MDTRPITKTPDGWTVQPNLVDYETTAASFSWEDVRSELSGLPDGRGLNIAYEAVDRHAEGARADKVAIRWLGKDGSRRDYTYGQLKTATAKFASLLDTLGIEAGGVQPRGPHPRVVHRSARNA